MRPRDIPVSVIVATRNEERNLPRCLAALERFDNVIVVDSGSSDKTQEVARSLGAEVIPFTWNGRYPKKRQWCLDHLALRHDWVLFVDADEEMSAALAEEISSLDLTDKAAIRGYFVRAAYVVGGKTLRFGLRNSKLCLFQKSAFRFPEIDDLDAPGMGEIEGHYQPCGKGDAPIGLLRNSLRHHAFDDMERWNARHDGYAAWHRHVLAKAIMPDDPSRLRNLFKKVFYALPLRPAAAFLHSYVMKLGFLDGREGFFLARSRYLYYRK